MTDVIERIDDVEAFLRNPGHYHTSTGHQAYGVLQSLGWHPRVRLGDELYFPEGSVLFAEVLDIDVDALTPNVATIDWGTTDDFYERRLRDYDNWETAFWRELVQNSRDAGATRVDIECIDDIYVDPETGDRTECIRCSSTDDGSGMSYDTLMDAFFRRGGTQKQVGSAGGFGDAKNLILTPWLGYEVHTQATIAQGRHEKLFADKLDQNAPYLSGTKVTVWMPLQKTTTPEHAQFLIEQSSLPNIVFSVNGKRVTYRLPAGKVVKQGDIKVSDKTVGKFTVRHSPRARRTGVYVRSYGIYTYEIGGYEDDFKGIVTIDVDAPPVDVFTTKRDGLSYSSTARADVFAVLKVLATDPRMALKAVRDKQELIIRGTGTIAVREGSVSQLAADIASKVSLRDHKRKKDGSISLDRSLVDALAQHVTDGIERIDDATSPSTAALSPLASTFNILVGQRDFADVEQITGAIRMAMWQPDFFVYQNISPWKMPKKLHPDTMAKKYHEIIRTWTEICRFLLVQFGIFEPFGVGWVFDTEYDPSSYSEAVIGALYRKHEGQHWLLVNPVEIERRSGDGFKTSGDRFKLSSQASREELVSLAVHEITHMQGFSGHGDAYAGALTNNLMAIFRIAPVLNKIIKVSRAAVAEERAAAEEERIDNPSDQDLKKDVLLDARTLGLRWEHNSELGTDLGFSSMKFGTFGGADNSDGMYLWYESRKYGDSWSVVRWRSNRRDEARPVDLGEYRALDHARYAAAYDYVGIAERFG